MSINQDNVVRAKIVTDGATRVYYGDKEGWLLDSKELYFLEEVSGHLTPICSYTLSKKESKRNWVAEMESKIGKTEVTLRELRRAIKYHKMKLARGYDRRNEPDPEPKKRRR